MNEWKTLNSKEVHKNPWYRLVQDDTLMPSGQQGKYTYVDRYDSVAIFALSPDNQIYLVCQYRYPIQRDSWEMPRGCMEKGETDSLVAAKRELLEEVGVEAQKWEKVGVFAMDTGLSNQLCHIFLAQNLIQKQAMPDYTEFLSAQKVSIEKFEQMIMDREIIDSHTIAAFYLFKSFKK